MEWTGLEYKLDWFSLIAKRRINKTTDANMTMPMTFEQRMEDYTSLTDILGVMIE